MKTNLLIAVCSLALLAGCATWGQKREAPEEVQADEVEAPAADCDEAARAARSAH